MRSTALFALTTLIAPFDGVNRRPRLVTTQSIEAYVQANSLFEIGFGESIRIAIFVHYSATAYGSRGRLCAGGTVECRVSAQKIRGDRAYVCRPAVYDRVLLTSGAN